MSKLKSVAAVAFRSEQVIDTFFSDNQQQRIFLVAVKKGHSRTNDVVSGDDR
jgi:hypothetical protein